MNCDMYIDTIHYNSLGNQRNNHLHKGLYMTLYNL